MQRRGQSACPHCGGMRTQGHGAFSRVDGTREPRRRCRACGRTFCAQTGTSAYYLKKRRQWEEMPRQMVQHRTVRRLGAVLGVRPATIFRWRHRLLGKIARQPETVLAGEVGLAEVLVRYSEKGNRKSVGPGAWRIRDRASRVRPFRRIADGKPSCVLVACGSGQLRTAIAGQGRASFAVAQVALGSMLALGATVWAGGFAVPAAVCHQVGYRTPAVPRSMWDWPDLYYATMVKGWDLRNWLRQFRGVATRYLSHYLAWFRHTCQDAEAALAA